MIKYNEMIARLQEIAHVEGLTSFRAQAAIAAIAYIHDLEAEMTDTRKQIARIKAGVL